MRRPKLLIFAAAVVTGVAFAAPKLVKRQSHAARAVARTGAPTEVTFQDPATGKFGKYTVLWPKNASDEKGRGVMAFFHGSGGAATYSATFPALAAIAEAHKLVPIALQAPSGDNWADGTGPTSNRHYDYVKSLLAKEVFDQHPDLSRKRTVFVGLSAGSTFLSGDFLSRHVADYAGGAVLLCGGGPPLAPWPEVMTPLPPATAQGFRFFAYIQTGDFLYQQTLEGLRYWRSRGAVAEAVTPAGGSHCGFDLKSALEQGLKSLQL